jgi:hypothetical protein
MTDLDKNLAETWGAAAQHSEYRRNDVVRYRVNDAIHTGTIIWIAGPRESHIEGHGMLPLCYVVTRQDWSGFPDIIRSSDILSNIRSSDILSVESAQESLEPWLERCPYCQMWHVEGGIEYCPKNPHREGE